jgi:hypothetical protein
MEHRYSNRFSFDVNVLIHRYGVPVAVGRIKNGTRFGLFIESEVEDVEAFQLLDIEILISINSLQLQRHKITSIVTHTTENGFGVEFDPIDGKTSDQLYNVLRETLTLPNYADFIEWRASA